jgi:hypothetical protein
MALVKNAYAVAGSQFYIGLPNHDGTRNVGTLKGDGSMMLDNITYKIGDAFPDGWVYAGISPSSGLPFSIEPFAGSLDGKYVTWKEGEKHATALREQGHTSARQPMAAPDGDEISAIYYGVVYAGHNHSAGFNALGGSAPFSSDQTNSSYCEYWSGSLEPLEEECAVAREFHRDHRSSYLGIGNGKARVRCVRDEPGLTLA